MAYLLGKRIKEIRERLGLSQKAACKHICSQAYISKIENGDVYPSADILLKLSDRLSIDISYLLDISNTPRHDYVIDFYTQVREAIYRRDYTAVQQLLHTEKGNRLFEDKKHKQFFLWHEGICHYEKDKDLDKAIECFDHALSLTTDYKLFYSEREIEILISKGNILTSNKQYEIAHKTYLEALYHLENLPNVTNKFVPIRLYYNLARLLRFMGQFKNSIFYCDEGIKICNKNNLLYLKGDLYFQKGCCYESLNNEDVALKNFTLAEMVYHLEGREKSLAMVQNTISPLRR